MIVDTEKVLREADGPVGRAALTAHFGWKGVRPGVRLESRSGEPVRSPKITSGSSRKSLRMQEENWKHQWLLLCLARQARKESMERPVARVIISSLNLRVSWKPVNPQECVWKNFITKIIMRTTLQEKEDNSLQHYNLVHKFIPMPQAMKIPAAKAAVDK